MRFKKGCASHDCVLLNVSLEPAQQRLQGLVRHGDGGCVLPALRGADAQRAAERRQQLRVLLSVDLLRREQRANLPRTRLLAEASMNAAVGIVQLTSQSWATDSGASGCGGGVAVGSRATSLSASISSAIAP